MRILLSIFIFVWSGLALSADLGMTFKHFYAKLNNQIEPMQNELSFVLPAYEQLVISDTNGGKIGLIELHPVIAISAMMSDEKANMNEVVALFATQTGDQIDSMRGLVTFIALTKIFTPAIQNNTDIIHEMLTETMQSGASSFDFNNFKYSMLKNEMGLLFNVKRIK